MTVLEKPARFLVMGWCRRCRREKMINRAGICARCFAELRAEAEQKKHPQKTPASGSGLIYGFAFEEDRPKIVNGRCVYPDEERQDD